MMAAVNSIAGMELSGRASWAGVPGTVFLLATQADPCLGRLNGTGWPARGLLFGLTSAAGGLLSGVIFASLG